MSAPKDVAARKAYKRADQQVALMTSGRQTEQLCHLVEIIYFYPNWGSNHPCILTQTETDIWLHWHTLTAKSFYCLVTDFSDMLEQHRLPELTKSSVSW